MFAKSLCNLAARLWNDDCGAVLTAEYLALGSVVVLGGVGGLVALRDGVNGEMKEYGNSVRSMRQSYSVPATRGGGAWKAGSSFQDSAPGNSQGDGAGASYSCDATP
jgi:hypothetical protein